MKWFTDLPLVYLHRTPVDFRKAINGLSSLVEQEMERSKFKWPIRHDSDVISIDEKELEWLLSGLDILPQEPHKTLYYQSVS